MSSGIVFVLLGILVLLHRGQQTICPISCFIMSYRGLCGFLDSFLASFSLLVSFCVLAGTGNSTTTLRYCILKQNNCFFLASIYVAVSFLAFCGVQTI